MRTHLFHQTLSWGRSCGRDHADRFLESLHHRGTPLDRCICTFVMLLSGLPEGELEIHQCNVFRWAHGHSSSFPAHVESGWLVRQATRHSLRTSSCQEPRACLLAGITPDTLQLLSKNAGDREADPAGRGNLYAEYEVRNYNAVMIWLIAMSEGSAHWFHDDRCHKEAR